MRRLRVPPPRDRPRFKNRVREISWSEFGLIARQFAERLDSSYRPDVILGIANGGLFIGGALARPLRAEFHPLQLGRRGKREKAPKLPSLAGKRVLVVDGVTVSGETLRLARALAIKAGAAEVRTAALVVRPGGSRPDYHVLETDDPVVFGWDYALHAAGSGMGDPGDVGV